MEGFETTGPVLVTGGAGFIGSHLVERLLQEGRAVTVIDDLSTGSLANLTAVQRHPRLTLIQSKVSSCPELSEHVRQSHLIYHLAAAVGVELVISSPAHTIETNLRETEAILEAAGRYRVPLLFTSTSEVYGKSSRPSFAEEDDLLIGPPHLGRWGYACSKLMDEFLAMAYFREQGLPVVIARLFNTVGPRQTGRYGMVLPRFIEAAKSGQPLRVFGDGHQTRCFSYVADTIEALVRLTQAPGAYGEVVNVGSTLEVTIQELAERVIELLCSRSPIEYLPYHEAYAPGFEDMPRRRPVTDKLFQLTGYLPERPLEEIIRHTAD